MLSVLACVLSILLGLISSCGVLESILLLAVWIGFGPCGSASARRWIGFGPSITGITARSWRFPAVSC